MQRYKLTLKGLTPLLMHQDNLAFTEKVRAWRLDPGNKENCDKGDDRSPAWTWIGSVYHDGKNFGLAADNLMTMLREGGAKVRTGKGQETYKKQTQAGVMIDQVQFPVYVGGALVPVAPFRELIGNLDFNDHLDLAEKYGFELSVKRAAINRSKHIRVRPMFRDWVAEGSITVMDPEVSGLTDGVLETILNQAGALCGIGDWRPSSPKSPGSFGKFEPVLERI